MLVNLEVERKIEVNRWIIKARWFYAVGILLIGILTKIISPPNFYFFPIEIFLLFAASLGLNIGFYSILKKIEKQKASGNLNMKLLSLLALSQLTAELLVFTYIAHRAGGIDFSSPAFFFLPIVSAALLFGPYGSIAVSVVSAALINTLVIAEYYNWIPSILYVSENTFNFESLPIALEHTITISIFYCITGLFSGFSTKLLFKREDLLSEQTGKLNEESELREEELKQLDRATKLLKTRDKELSDKNWILDAKIKELEASKNSLTGALNEVKDAKMKSEEEKNKTLAIISNFTDPIIVFDKENRLSLFNLAAQVALGLRSADLGTAVNMRDDLTLDSVRTLIRKDFEFKKLKTDKENSLLTEELRINEEGGEQVYKVVTVKVKDSWGNSTGVMKIFFDITREKLIDQMKSDFISIAAHQLRTPLSAIKWSTGMLLNGDVGPLNIEQENFLRKSYVSNEAMINLVNDLLNVSRIEEGRFGYNFKYLTIQEILDVVIENTKQQIEKAGIVLKVDNKEKHVQICLDKEKLVLAFQNLLENAIKYTPRYGTIDIAVKKSEDNYLVVSVKDSGVGIPKKEQGKIFSKFFRATNVVLMETEGTGLGLFIVKNIVERHGGKISLESVEHKGTEVIISLPIECKI